MNQLIMFAAAGEGPFGEIAKNFGLTKQMFFSQVVAFLIVAWVLKKFAYQPVLVMLEERRKRIAEGLANAEKIKEDLAKTETTRQEIMNQANVQANRLIEEARAAAERVREQKNQETIAQVNQLTRAQLPEGEDYETVAGLLLDRCKRIPRVGEIVRLPGTTITIMTANERAIEEVRIKVHRRA